MMPLYAYRDNSCDPRKCTVKKLEKSGLLKIFNKISQIPRNTLLLDPTAEHALSPADKYVRSLTVPGLLMDSTGCRESSLVEDPQGAPIFSGSKPGKFRQTLCALIC